MKKFLLALSVLGLVSVSCSRDNDENISDNGNKEIPILPTKFIHEDGVSELKYDGDKLLEIVNKYDETETVTFKYDGDKIVERTIIEPNNDKEIAKYYYTSDNKLKSSSLYMEETDNGTKYITNYNREYTYNTDGTISVVEKRKYINSNVESIVNYTYTISNGNLAKKVETRDGETYVRTYTYGNKNTPFKNVRGFDLLLLEFEEDNFGINVSKNQLISTQLEREGEILEAHSYTYEYNDKGYPIKEVEKQLKTNHSNEYEYTIKFEYNK